MQSSGKISLTTSRGITAIGIFLVFGAAMASLAGITLVWPGTILDRVWALNPRAYGQLVSYGVPAGILFLLLAVALAVAALGWLKRQRWGWRLAVVLIGTQVLGDFLNIFSGHILQGAVGVTIAGVLFIYMTRARLSSTFSNSSEKIVPTVGP